MDFVAGIFVPYTYFKDMPFFHFITKEDYALSKKMPYNPKSNLMQTGNMIFFSFTGMFFVFFLLGKMAIALQIKPMRVGEVLEKHLQKRHSRKHSVQTKSHSLSV